MLLDLRLFSGCLSFHNFSFGGGLCCFSFCLLSFSLFLFGGESPCLFLLFEIGLGLSSLLFDLLLLGLGLLSCDFSLIIEHILDLFELLCLLLLPLLFRLCLCLHSGLIIFQSLFLLLLGGILLLPLLDRLLLLLGLVLFHFLD